jgi:hypothetical protein
VLYEKMFVFMPPLRALEYHGIKDRKKNLLDPFFCTFNPQNINYFSATEALREGGRLKL